MEMDLSEEEITDTSEEEEEISHLSEEDIANLERKVEESKRILALINQIIVRQYYYILKLNEKISALENDIETAPDIQNTSTSSISEEAKQVEVSVPAGGDDILQYIPKYAEDVFPEEVWALILSYFCDEFEVWKLSRTCQVFERAALRPSKNEWLFRKLFPLLFQYMEDNDVLKCREVSPNWKKTVDEFYQYHPSRLPYDEKIHDPRKANLFNQQLDEEMLFGSCNIDNDTESSEEPPEDHKLLLSIVGHPNSSSPFITRSLYITIDSEKLSIRNLRNGSDLLSVSIFPHLLPFFKEFGKHFWYLDVKYTKTKEQQTSTTELISLIHFLSKELLCNTPNIRRLKLQSDNLTSATNTDEQKNISELLQSLPNLESLEAVEFDLLGRSMPKSPPLLRYFLTKYHRQLKYLEVHNMKILEYENVLKFDWQNLVELRLGSFFDTDAFENVLRWNAPNLKKLSLEPIPLYLTTVLKLINLLPSSAKVIHLKVPFFSGDHYRDVEDALEDIPFYLYAHPRLETLEIDREYANQTCYSFLLKFPFVKNIFINREKHSTRTSFGPEIVEVNKYLKSKRMYESNIWELLFNLKVLTIGKTMYTREGYRHFREKKGI